MRKSVLVLLAVASMVAMMTSPAPAPPLVLDVNEIYIEQYKDFWDGSAEPSPYGFEVWINGSGITGVSVEDPHGVNHVLSNWGDYWEFDEGGFASLATLDASYGPGEYVFSFNGGADSVTLNYQYSEPTSFANITYPTDGQTDVELNPIYTWDSVAGYANADALGMWVVEDPDGFGDDLYWNGPVFDLTTTSWQPGTLAGLTEYEFEISVMTAQAGVPIATQTNIFADDFDYYGLFESINMVGFETVSEIPGDFDADADVDGVDFGLWQTGYPTASGASHGDGDADGDGDVDGVDFGIWQENYPTNLGAAVMTTTVPEPGTLGLLFLGSLALLTNRKRILS